MTQSSTLKFITDRIILLKLMGLASFTIVNGKLVTKPTDILFLIFGVGFGCFICYFSFANRGELMVSKSAIANFGNLVAFIASTLVSICSMIFAFIFRRRIWSMIVRLAEVEEMVKLSKYYSAD